MGGGVFSAAVIMAGTFGSMMATGMATVVEIGLSVVVGLFLYVFVLLAFSCRRPSPWWDRPIRGRS